MSIKKITLPLEKGKYILNQKAVDVLKQASYIKISYEVRNNERLEGNCWMCVGVMVKVGTVEGEAVFALPINLRGVENFSGDWSFVHEQEISATYAQHPLQRLVEEGAILEFEPVEEALSSNRLRELGMAGDAIYWILKINGEPIKDRFATSITNYDSPGRLIQRPDRQAVKTA